MIFAHSHDSLESLAALLSMETYLKTQKNGIQVLPGRERETGSIREDELMKKKEKEKEEK